MNKNKGDVLKRLRIFLQTPTVFKEECGVVYFLVEIRKLIEDNKENFKTLYFYCCWVAHSKLSYPDIADFLSAKFDSHINLQKKKTEIQRDLIDGQGDFFKLKDLNNELKTFVRVNKMTNSFLEGNPWYKFCQLFLDNITECEIDLSAVTKKSHKIDKLIVEKNNQRYLYGFYLANGIRIPRIILKYKNK